MGRRSRSKSPRSRRDRDRERQRDRDRQHRRKRSRERADVSRDRDGRRRHSPNDRLPDYRRYSSRSRSRSRSEDAAAAARGKRGAAGGAAAAERPVVTAADLEGKSPDEQEMMRTMGFCSFDSTKGKKVEGNDVGDVHVILKRKYRQYMNRKGGFNRPLDFVA